jgi:hypothetical protein
MMELTKRITALGSPNALTNSLCPEVDVADILYWLCLTNVSNCSQYHTYRHLYCIIVEQ